jgi:predicted DsbA family dithiol-disulfide isomerase/uncharacterized membrane protein
MLEQLNQLEVSPLELPQVGSDRVESAVSFRAQFVLFLLLAGGLVATGMLSYQWVFHVPLPGCGPQSACQRAAASDFALLFQIPVAYFGFAYMSALLIGWLDYGRRGAPPLMVWITRAGAAVSAIFLVLIVEHEDYCLYCMAAHTCNLAIWGITELVARSSSRLRPSFVLGGTFLAVMLGFHLAKNHEVDTYHAKRDAETQKIIDKLVRSEESQGGHTTAWLPVAAAGGHRFGSDDAPIRITVFFDYQCGFCKTLDRFVEKLRERGNVAVTWRNYPGNTTCNSYIGRDSHPGACWAARLALAAGKVGGEDAFLRMHRWLFEHDGEFNDNDIEQALPELNIGDADAFWAAVHSPAIRDALRADVDLAHELGVQNTPSIFINGILLDSWAPKLALERAVHALGGEASEECEAEH